MVGDVIAHGEILWFIVWRCGGSLFGDVVAHCLEMWWLTVWISKFKAHGNNTYLVNFALLNLYCNCTVIYPNNFALQNSMQHCTNTKLILLIGEYVRVDRQMAYTIQLDLIRKHFFVLL